MFIGCVDDYLLKTLDPSFKGAVLRYGSIISYMNQVNKHNFTLKVLNEAFVTNQFVFYFTKNFYLVDEINQKIGQFHSSGLIKFWMSKYSDDEEKNKKEMPSILNMKRLEGIFEIFLFGLLFATSVFVFELFLNHVKKLKFFQLISANC